jgi:hypothetical protein
MDKSTTAPTEPQVCNCGDNLQQFCSMCPPERMKRVQWNQAKAQNNSSLQRKKKHGPIGKYVVVAEPGGKKQLHRRMEFARQQMSQKLGRRVSKKEFALVHQAIMADLKKKEGNLPQTQTMIPASLKSVPTPQPPSQQQVTENKLKSAIQFGVQARKCVQCDYVANGARDLEIHVSRQHQPEPEGAPERM